MARIIGKRIKLVGLVVVIIMLLVPVGFYFSWRYWEQFQTMMGDKFITRVGAVAIGTERITYNLVEGWNFIAFPMEPITVRSAAELVKDVGDSGGYITMVSRWNGDRWQEYAKRGGEVFGMDFPLKAGEGYFIQNHQAVTWEIVGSPPSDSGSYAKLNLRPGWNAVGLHPINISKAVHVLDKANVGGVERTDEIDQWQSGNWQSLIKRWYSPENIQEYGDDFPLSDTRGYMIRAHEPVVISTTE